MKLTVMVPTRDRPERVHELLSRLAVQTLPPERFEVVIVDDGSAEPLAARGLGSEMDVRVVRQAPAGPAAARNRALALARAPLVLLLNDDAVPAPDLLEAHVRAHETEDGPVAVLGTFDFTSRSLCSPFVRLLDGTSLLFDYVSMQAGRRYDWRYFWTCNLSASTSVLRSVGGFDAARFDEAIVEDVELGYRLRQIGVDVLFRPQARCEHDHVLTVDSYFRRMIRLGVYLRRMYEKHGDPLILWQRPDFVLDERALLKLQVRVEVAEPFVREAVAELREYERAAPESVDPAHLERLRALCRRVGIERFHAGILLDVLGIDVPGALEEPARGRVSVVVVNRGDGPVTLARTWESLSDAAALEVVLVGDIRGVPAGVPWRRCGSASEVHTTCDWVLEADAEADVTGEEWLSALLRHGRADPCVARVSPLTVEKGTVARPVAANGSFEYVSALAPGVVLTRCRQPDRTGTEQTRVSRCRVAHDVTATVPVGRLDPALAGAPVVSSAWGRPWTVASDLESWVRALEPLRRPGSGARASHGEAVR